jgi:hypothetical protein
MAVYEVSLNSGQLSGLLTSDRGLQGLVESRLDSPFQAESEFAAHFGLHRCGVSWQISRMKFMIQGFTRGGVMHRCTIILFLFTGFLVIGPAASYGQDPAAGPATPEVLATVNGTPISRDDIIYRIRRTKGHGELALTEGDLKKLLDEIIQEELIYQQAMALGLDADPGYRQALARVMVQVNAYKRKKLSKVFFRREVTEKATISDAEAREYFAENAGRIRTELHVHRILKRKEADIQKIVQALEQGEPFESIARKQFPKLPQTAQKPWDMGYLEWKKIPEPWRNRLYALQVGAHSGILRGPNSRFFIFKVVDRRENPDRTFADVEPAIKMILQIKKTHHLHQKALQELRDGAHIELNAQSLKAFTDKIATQTDD